MQLTRRRAVVVAIAAATLAAVIAERKLREGERAGLPMLRLDLEQAPRLRSFADAVQRTDPPTALPPIRFTAADGSPRDLADFRGKALVLNLWATWCAPCDAELPSLDALAARMAPDGVLVLPLASDQGGAAAVERYYKAHGIAHLGIWLDPDGAAQQALGARGIPTTLLVDRQGRERARLEGGIDWADPPAPDLIRKLVG